jgi:SAM-dependent methyltransferase
MTAPRVAVLAAGGAAAFFGGIAAVSFLAAPKACVLPRLTEVDRLRIFSEGASAFDAHVDKAERALGVGMGARRAALIARARGDVVEVCAGGGRNNALYDARSVTSLTLTDFAPGALALAAQRPCSSSHLVPKVLVADAHALPLPDASADAVVDSFGLCSLHSPEAALAEWVRVLRPGGRLLLLEHGRSRWFPPVNWLLDNPSPLHPNSIADPCAVDATHGPAAARAVLVGWTLLKKNILLCLYKTLSLCTFHSCACASCTLRCSPPPPPPPTPRHQ